MSSLGRPLTVYVQCQRTSAAPAERSRSTRPARVGQRPWPRPAPAPRLPRRVPQHAHQGCCVRALYRVLRYRTSSPILLASYLRVLNCSFVQVIEAYEKQGFAMMLRAFNEPGFLETLTGLDQLYKEGEDALDNVDWDVGDDDDDGM